MPLYEDRSRACNRLDLDASLTGEIVIGFAPVIERLAALVRETSAHLGRAARLAFDGYYGIDWNRVAAALRQTASRTAVRLETISINGVYRSQADIAAYKKRFTDIGDPGFGWVNLDGQEQDLMVPAGIQALRDRITAAAATQVVYGPGAAVPGLLDAYDLVFYFDKTRQPILWDLWDGKLVPFGTDEPRGNYSWKEYYYCDYYLLDAEKAFVLPRMHYWVEAISPDTLKLVPRAVYDAMVKTQLAHPIKQVPIFQPGPWGAYRYRDFFDVPGLECNAWNETAGPELSLLVDVGREQPVNLPVTNLLQYPVEFVGPHIAGRYPRCFPLDVWLDDGYFPEPQPAERTSMPIHNHPSTGYVRQHFNEVIGRYETYYIAEAYEGANTWMGYREDADLEEWERLCRDSSNLKQIPNWKDFIAGWPTNRGDLFLIPPGTTHAHGGNQMVLEMDTSAGIAATEYSFFAYDFARHSWDDATKTMTGRPLKMHLDHAFDNDTYCRESYVARHLRARPIVRKWTAEYRLDQFTSDPRMPFHIERLRFQKRAEHGTEGRILHILTLTMGTEVIVRSRSTGAAASIGLWQSCILAASFGAYEVVNAREGECEVVVLRWKE
jgi:hypothetical protein